MKKFEFRLKTLLNYREQLEELSKQNYREALARHSSYQEMLEENRKRRNEAAIALSAMPLNHPLYPLMALTDHYLRQLSYLIEEQALTLLELEKTAREKLEEYRARYREAEAIRRLREKKWRNYLREMEREEQKLQDDLFIARWPTGVTEQ